MNDINAIFEAGLKVFEADKFVYKAPISSLCEENEHILKSRRKKRKLRILKCNKCNAKIEVQFRRKGKWESIKYVLKHRDPIILNDQWTINLR
jgi:hypothetical protein